MQCGWDLRLSKLEKATITAKPVTTRYRTPEQLRQEARAERIVREFERRWNLYTQTSENLQVLVNVLDIYREVAVGNRDTECIAKCDRMRGEVSQLRTVLETRCVQAT